MKRVSFCYRYIDAMRGPDDCWLWDGPLDKHGYGRCGGGLAHRRAWLETHGADADGLVCHKCDNPRCINPAHLFVGTTKINGVDCALKGRAHNQHGGQDQTRCINGHEYTPENTYWRPGKVASRDCRACQRERTRRYLSRKAKAA